MLILIYIYIFLYQAAIKSNKHDNLNISSRWRFGWCQSDFLPFFPFIKRLKSSTFGEKNGPNRCEETDFVGHPIVLQSDQAANPTGGHFVSPFHRPRLCTLEGSCAQLSWTLPNVFKIPVERIHKTLNFWKSVHRPCFFKKLCCYLPHVTFQLVYIKKSQAFRACWGMSPVNFGSTVGFGWVKDEPWKTAYEEILPLTKNQND